MARVGSVRAGLIRCVAMLAIAALGSGCYHYSFEHQTAASRPQAGRRVLVTYAEREATYLNGFIGTGKLDTTRYCAEPVRTELRVTATDVLVSVATLLVYTPHTLYVTCDASATAEARGAGGAAGRGAR